MFILTFLPLEIPNSLGLDFVPFHPGQTMKRKRFVFIILTLIKLFSAFGVQAQANIKFERLSLRDGLSQSSVRCLYQDHLGFLWAGTDDGLNLYDGYQFTVLKNDPADTSSLSNNTINAIAEDSLGYLWVGTNKGLNKLNRHTGQFETYFSWFNDSSTISNNLITALLEDSEGRLWVGTDNGLNLYQPSTDNFKVFSLNLKDPHSISNNRINAIREGRDGRIWVATEGGVNLYTDSLQGFIRYRAGFNDQNALISNSVKCLAFGPRGNLWIGTDKGLDQLVLKSGRFKHYSTENLMSSQVITALEFDNKGQLWVGTQEGLAKFDSRRHKLRISGRMSTNGFSRNGNYVQCLLEDNSGLLWIGSRGAGLFILDKSLQYFTHHHFQNTSDEIKEENTDCFLQLSPDTVLVGTTGGLLIWLRNDDRFVIPKGRRFPLSKLADVSVKSLLNMGDTLLWAGTSDDGLYKLDLRSGKLAKYQYQPQGPGGLSSNNINQLVYSDEGILYIATIGGGLCELDLETDSISVLKYKPGDPNSLKDNNILCLALDNSGLVWMGTSNAGLYSYNPETGELHQYAYRAGDLRSLGSNGVYAIQPGADDALWIGTRGGGLNKLTPDRKHFLRLGENQGIANDVVHAIVKDTRGDLWMSTNKGITYFNPHQEIFRNYSESDGLVNNSYNLDAGIQLKDGTIAFGGITGIDDFQADEIETNQHIPPVQITAFNLLQPDVTGRLFIGGSGGDEIPGHKITLSHDDPGFTIQFTALDYHRPEKNQYAFKMEGLIDKWVYIGNRHYTSFTSLRPGKYVFRVKASNNDGVWNQKGAYLNIIVQPAYYQTMWFQAGGLILFVFILWLAYQLRVSRIQRQKKLLQEQVKLRTAEIAKERDTNVTLLREIHHRVKNNLQIINSLLSLQSRYVSDSEVIALFEEIQNRIRSMSLIHQKMYKTKDLATVNIVEYISDLVNSLVRTYRLDEKIELDMDIEVTRFSSDTLTPLGLIINEVISNALKYAFRDGKSGKILVHIKKTGESEYKMLIGDNGIGIDTGRDFNDSNTFGTELIVALTEQLNGHIRRLTEAEGTMYEVLFKDIEN